MTIPCPNCASRQTVKNGHTPNGAQRYLCKRCRKPWTLSAVRIESYAVFPTEEAWLMATGAQARWFGGCVELKVNEKTIRRPTLEEAVAALRVRV